MFPGDIKKLCFKELCWTKACENLHWGQAGGLLDWGWQWTRVCSPGGLAVSPGKPSKMLCFQVPLELHCGGCVSFVTGMVSLFRRRVLPSSCEVAIEEAGELRTGPLPPRPANKTATWPKLTSGNQKARCLFCPLMHGDAQRTEKRPQRCPSVLQNFPML